MNIEKDVVGKRSGTGIWIARKVEQLEAQMDERVQQAVHACENSSVHVLHHTNQIFFRSVTHEYM